MAKIILESWREGFEKVSLTKLQVSILGKSLKESKLNVDSLLDGKLIIIELNDIKCAKEFLKAADKIGVNCKLVIEKP